METGIKAFAENVGDVRTLFQLRATCKWLKQVCDDRLRAIRPSVDGWTPEGSNLLADLRSDCCAMLAYPHVKFVADTALEKAGDDALEAFLDVHAREFAANVSSPTTLRAALDYVSRRSLMCAFAGKEARFAWHATTELVRGAALLNDSDYIASEAFRMWPSACAVDPEVEERLASLPAIREELFHGCYGTSPYRHADFVRKHMDLVMEEWKRKSDGRYFVPFTMAAMNGEEDLLEEFKRANPNAYAMCELEVYICDNTLL